MATLRDGELLRLIREHLDVEGLLAAHPEVTRADLEAFWARHGLGSPKATAQRELFEEPPAEAEGRCRPLHLIARCDGAARGNPGPAAIGCVLTDAADGQEVLEISEAIGRATSNVAEYTAVIRAAQKALALRATELSLLLDSQLLVRQLSGVYKVKAPHLRRLHQRALDLLGRLRRWEARHVPREENAPADRLARQALRTQRSGS